MYDQLVMQDGEPRTGRLPSKEEREQAQQARREESARKQQEWQQLAAGTTWLPALGVAVRDGNIYQHGAGQHGMHSGLPEAAGRAGRAEMTLPGPLAGAHAEVGGGRAGRRRSGDQIAADTAFNTVMLGPAGLLSLLSRKGFEIFAVVSFADGTVYDKTFDKESTDASLLIRAQGEAARFNALAASSRSARGPEPGLASSLSRDGIGVTAELERLAALHSSGVLDDDESRAAKARIISG